MSLEDGRVPESWDTLLKKLGLDLEFENFRLANNLPFVAKK